MRDFSLIRFLTEKFFLGSPLLYAEEIQAPTQFLPDYRTSQPLVGGDNFTTFLTVLLRLGFSLIIVIILIYLAIYLLKRFSPSYTKSPIFFKPTTSGILEALPLDYKHSIFLINIYNKRILIVFFSDRQIQLLDKITDPAEVEEIISKLKERYKETLTFKEKLSLLHKKNLIQSALRKYIRQLTSFFRRS